MIVFMSDWGYNSYYVGIAKSVIYSISPNSTVVDLIHTILPFNVREAAHIVERTFGDLPRGSVLLSVVDPGVGTERKPIVLEVDGKYCVGPDNGTFTRILSGNYHCRVLENPKYMYRIPPSKTFHGRDIFAPAAAYLDSGVKLEEFGPEWKPLKIEFKEIEIGEGFVKCEVAYVDGFGNVETTLKLRDLEDAGIGKIFFVNGIRTRLVERYAEVKEGLLAHLDSSGYLEISVNQGSASKMLSVSCGNELLITKE